MSETTSQPTQQSNEDSLRVWDRAMLIMYEWDPQIAETYDRFGKLEHADPESGFYVVYTDGWPGTMRHNIACNEENDLKMREALFQANSELREEGKVAEMFVQTPTIRPMLKSEIFVE